MKTMRPYSELTFDSERAQALMLCKETTTLVWTLTSGTGRPIRHRDLNEALRAVEAYTTNRAQNMSLFSRWEHLEMARLHTLMAKLAGLKRSLCDLGYNEEQEQAY